MFTPLHSATNEEQVGEAPLQSIQSPRKVRMIRTPQLSITYSKVKVAIMLHFQLCSSRFTVLQQRTVGEVLLQSIQSPWKYGQFP